MRALALLFLVPAIACTRAAAPGADAQPTPGGDQSSPAAAVPPASADPMPVKLTAFKVHDDLGNTAELKLANLARVTIDSTFQAAPGKHEQQVDVIDPGGILYGRVRGQAIAGSDGTATMRQALEVAGTTIEHYQMTGAWQFVLSVDGAPLASTTVDIVR